MFYCSETRACRINPARLARSAVELAMIPRAAVGAGKSAQQRSESAAITLAPKELRVS
jgi:hypothetical protein